MNPIVCADVQHWLKSGDLTPSREIARHVSACPQCRNAVYTTLATLLPHSAHPIDCEECQQDLPAFIDSEILYPIQAMQWYANVWHHLWVCQDCAEVYEFMRSLILEEQAIITPSVQTIKLPLTPMFKPLAVLSEAVMHVIRSVATLNHLAAVPRGSNESIQFLLSNKPFIDSTYIGTVIAVYNNPEYWSLVVNIQPHDQLTLRATVGIGKDKYSEVAQPNAQGIAVFTKIPAKLLLSKGNDVVLECQQSI